MLQGVTVKQHALACTEKGKRWGNDPRRGGRFMIRKSWPRRTDEGETAATAPRTDYVWVSCALERGGLANYGTLYLRRIGDWRACRSELQSQGRDQGQGWEVCITLCMSVQTWGRKAHSRSHFDVTNMWSLISQSETSASTFNVNEACTKFDHVAPPGINGASLSFRLS